MSTESTQAVLEHHAKALLEGDLDEVMKDYAEHSVFISNLGGVITGLDRIRSAFGAAGDFPGFEETAAHVEGEFGYVTWNMTGVSFGTDTFVVRDGKIVLQTVAMVFA